MAAMSAANEAATICIGTQVICSGHKDAATVAKAASFMDERRKFKNIPDSFWEEIEAIANMAAVGTMAVKQQQGEMAGLHREGKEHEQQPAQGSSAASSAALARKAPDGVKQEPSSASTAAPSSGAAKPKGMVMKRRRLA